MEHTITLLDFGAKEDNSPSEVFRTHIVELCDAFAANLDRITNGLFAKKLIGQSVLQTTTTEGISTFKKSSKVVHTLYNALLHHENPEQYLSKIFDVLLKEDDQTLTDIVMRIKANL